MADRASLELELGRMAGEGAARERLLDRLYELERLIIETPSDEPVALRAKAAILLWYMEMEQADGLPAMRHIAGFLDRLH